MECRRFESGTRWEPLVGYARAVRVGRQVYVSGTTAVGPDGEIIGIGDPYRQTVAAIQNIRRALRALEADLEDIVRTRVYVTNINHWPDVGRARGEFFRDIRRAATMVDVSRLISPDLLVEVEAEAVVDAEDPN